MEVLTTQEPKRSSGVKRFFRILLIALILIGGIVFYVKYYYVFGEGTKAGQLNFIVKKGYLFKTYEGRIIQTGYKGNVAGSIQSNEFDFSVVNEKVAATLMANSGAMLELHYREYLGAPVWRGMSKYIVDSIISIHRTIDNNNPIP